MTDQPVTCSLCGARAEVIRNFTNGIENSWSHSKRGIDSIYHQISEEHLQAYINEFVLRFNIRKFTIQNMFDIVLSGIR